MDLDALNRDPILHDTPLGRLRLERYGAGPKAWIGVVMVPPGPFDPCAPARIIHTLEPGSDVFAALYGRRFWESDAIHRAWLAQQDAEELEGIKADADSSAQGRELFERALGARP